jgi:hypothetical protein
MGAGLVWGWVFGSVWALARWDAALWDGLTFLLLGCGVVAVAHLARGHGKGGATVPGAP